MAEIGSVSPSEEADMNEVIVRGGKLIGFKTSTTLTSDAP